MFTFRFFASNADFASFSFFPTTPGTTTCGIPEPMLTCILTTSPAFAVEFASVSWLITIPSFMSLFTSSTFSAFSLASSNFLTASSYVSPITFGTIVVSVPLLTLTDTLFFCFILYPSL